MLLDSSLSGAMQQELSVHCLYMLNVVQRPVLRSTRIAGEQCGWQPPNRLTLQNTAISGWTCLCCSSPVSMAAMALE